MNSDILEALTIIEEEENRTKKDIEIIREAKQEIKNLTSIIVLRYERPYAKRYLEELRKEQPNLLYPDSEKIYEDYYELKGRTNKAIEYIEKHSNSLSVLDTISNAELLKILKGSDKE